MYIYIIYMNRDHHIYGGSTRVSDTPICLIHPNNVHLIPKDYHFRQLGQKNRAEQHSMPSLLDPGDAMKEEDDCWGCSCVSMIILAWTITATAYSI